jgi:hypothetical protein
LGEGIELGENEWKMLYRNADSINEEVEKIVKK